MILNLIQEVVYTLTCSEDPSDGVDHAPSTLGKALVHSEHTADVNRDRHRQIAGGVIVTVVASKVITISVPVHTAIRRSRGQAGD